MNFAAEAFVWMVLACFVEVLVTATVERLSLGDRYVLAGHRCRATPRCGTSSTASASRRAFAS